MCLEQDLGRDRVEEREIWDEDEERAELEDEFVSMVGESSSRRSNRIIQITNDTTATWSVVLKQLIWCSNKKYTKFSFTQYICLQMKAQSVIYQVLSTRDTGYAITNSMMIVKSVIIWIWLSLFIVGEEN